MAPSDGPKPKREKGEREKDWLERLDEWAFGSDEEEEEEPDEEEGDDEDEEEEDDD